MKGHHQIKKLDYNYITDGIYIGTNQCCQGHFEGELIDRGITADVSLEKEKVDAPFGVEFYLWLPVEDNAAPSQDQLRVGVAALNQLVRLERKTYVHCMNGHGRAPTLVAAYFIGKGKNVNEAVELIKTKRPTIHLEKAQLQALEEYAKWIRKS